VGLFTSRTVFDSWNVSKSSFHEADQGQIRRETEGSELGTFSGISHQLLSVRRRKSNVHEVWSSPINKGALSQWGSCVFDIACGQSWTPCTPGYQLHR
jgi:hypothetical protein